MRILHVIATLAVRCGGPSVALPAICRALCERGHTVEIWTTDVHGRQLAGELPVACFRAHWPRGYAASIGLGAALRRGVAAFDVVHIDSLYLFHTHAAGSCCRRLGIPYVVRPHGTLDPYHRARHRGRKRIYDLLVQRRILDGAGAIHYTSERERIFAELAGVRAPGFVVPLGVDPAEPGPALPRVALDARHPELAGRELVTFLGRLTAKKRLDVLLDAFCEVVRTHPQAHLVVAGPDDEGIGVRLRARARKRGIASRISWPGIVDGQDKAMLLRHTSVFVLPSEDESFALAVAEAMAAGVPVVVSDAVAIQDEIAAADAGAVVPVAAGPVAGAICDMLSDHELRRRRSENARALVQRRFSSSSVARQLEDVYAALLEHPRMAPSPARLAERAA